MPLDLREQGAHVLFTTDLYPPLTSTSSNTPLLFTLAAMQYMQRYILRQVGSCRGAWRRARTFLGR